MLAKSLSRNANRQYDEEIGETPLCPAPTPITPVVSRSTTLTERIQRSISGRGNEPIDGPAKPQVSVIVPGQDILWRVQSERSKRVKESPRPQDIPEASVLQRVVSASGSAPAAKQLERVKSAKAEAAKNSAAAMITSITAHQLELPDLEQSFGTNLQTGLSSSEASSRLARDGKNAITPPPQIPWIIRMGVHFVGGFQFLLVGAGILCIILYTAVDTTHDKSNLYLAIVLFAVVIITGVFSATQESKSEKLMEGFNSLAAKTATVVRDGAIKTINAVEIVAGDVVLVEAGQQCPADIRVIECNVLRVDNSSLTGEPEPLMRTVNCTNENPMETKNIAFSGTGIVEGKGRGVVFATGDRTVMGRIAGAAGSAEKPESTLRQEIRYFIIRMAILSLSMAGIFLIISKVRGNDWPTSLVFCIGVITANVPEGLLPQMTVQLTLTAKQMSKRNVLVKNLEIIETLGSTTCIASDKTGTLTQNKMTVSHMYYDDQIWNTGVNVVSGNEYQTFDLSSKGFNVLKDVGILGSRAYFILEPGETINLETTKVKGDASETAIVKFLQPIQDLSEYRASHPQEVEIPFNSNNKWALSINRMTDGSYTLFMKGAPERILLRCSTINIQGQPIAIDDQWKGRIQKANTELARRGERVLGFARLPLDPVKYPPHFRFDNENINFPLEGLQFCGLISLIDPPRVGVKESVATCQEAGIRVMMVTGDHPETARAIAKSIGIMPGKTIQEVAEESGRPVSEVDKNIVEAVVVTGTQLMEFSEADWEYTLSRKQIVFARTMPQQKQEIVRRLQDRNEVVAVTGDGTNDSPALKQAACGVAMGIAGSEIAKEAAQVILLDDNFSSLVVGIEEGRLIFDNLKKCIYYTLTHLTPEMLPFLLFIAANIPLGLSTLMIMTIDLGSELVSAVSLAWERGESAVMKKPPRNILTDRLVNRKVFFLSYLVYGIWEAFVGFWAYFWVLIHEYGFPFGKLWGVGIGFDKDDKASYDDDLISSNTKWGQVKGSYGNFQEYRVIAIKEAQSAFLFAIAISQLANIMMAKSRYTSVIHAKLNRIMVIGQILAMCVMVLVIYCPGIQDFFFTHAVHGYIFALILPTIPIMFIFDETRKFLLRRGNKCVTVLTDY